MPSSKGAGGFRRAACVCAAVASGALVAPGKAHGAVAHVVQPGETLWSIAAANNLTTRTVAVFNGIGEDAHVIEGQTINVPTVEEGAAALAAAPATAPPTPGAAPGGHLVVAGESLSSVAAANGITVGSLAAANGLAADAYLIEGQTITIPAVTSATAAGSSDTYGMGHIPSPHGELHLAPAAADSWNAMREDSLANFGVDLYPEGPASAYRTTEQQQELYDLYLSGEGAPANPPGTSSHETGNAVDVAEPVMRDVIDQIGGAYGWSGTIPSEWWHVGFSGW